jgi:hypothetical protein
VSVLEAIIAVVIAFGIVAGAIEASRMAASRAALASLDAEVAIRAERLIASVGTERPLAAQHDEGSEEGGVGWTLEVAPYAEDAKAPLAFDIVAEVTIRRGDLSARQRIATLKLRPEPSR